jgi:hypothetical protein
MSIIFTLIGIVILLGIVSTIYVDGDLQLTVENTKEFGTKVLDTIDIWRMQE